MASQHRRVLLVEDDPEVGRRVAAMLERADYDVDGPHLTLADAMAALARHFPDCAVMDVSLHRQDAGLLADDLAMYDIPFILCAGRGDGDRLPRNFPAAPLLHKDQLGATLLPMLDVTLH